MVDLRNMRVLIADDMEGMRRALYGLLKVLNFGRNFIYASNGQEAIKILEQEPIDLALLDLNMPIMSGVEVLEHVRNDRQLRDLPIIIITGESNSEVVAEAAESDIDAYILKPVTAKALGAKITSIMEAVNNPSPMMLHLRNARRFEEAGDLNSAIKEAELARQANPDSSRPIREMAYLHYNNNEIKEAKRLFLQAANMNELDIFAFHYLGEIYLQLDNLDNAEKFFSKAMEISPRHVERGVYFGKVLIKKGQLKRAREILNHALELTQEQYSVRNDVADFCIDQRVYEMAVEMLQEIADELPGDSPLNYKLAKAYDGTGNAKQALKYYSKVNGGEESEDPELKIHIAQNYISLGWPMHAERVLKSILEDYPDHEEANRLILECV